MKEQILSYEQLKKQHDELTYKAEDMYDAMCTRWNKLDNTQKESMEELANCLRKIKKQSETNRQVYGTLKGGN